MDEEGVEIEEEDDEEEDGEEVVDGGAGVSIPRSANNDNGNSTMGLIDGDGGSSSLSSFTMEGCEDTLVVAEVVLSGVISVVDDDTSLVVEEEDDDDEDTPGNGGALNRGS